MMCIFFFHCDPKINFESRKGATLDVFFLLKYIMICKFLRKYFRNYKLNRVLWYDLSLKLALGSGELKRNALKVKFASSFLHMNRISLIPLRRPLYARIAISRLTDAGTTQIQAACQFACDMLRFAEVSQTFHFCAWAHHLYWRCTLSMIGFSISIFIRGQIKWFQS